MTYVDISNNLFEAIDLIVDKKLAEVEFDRTVLVTVKQIPEDSNGQYQVEWQGAKLEAFSTNDYIYQIDDIAYMLIPRNRMDQDKFLLGPVKYYRKEKKEE